MTIFSAVLTILLLIYLTVAMFLARNGFEARQTLRPSTLLAPCR